MYPKLNDFELLHKGDFLIKPIENKVVVNNIITTTIPSIIQHRPDKGEVVLSNSSVINANDIVRFNLQFGIDIMFEEGHYILLNDEKIIGLEID